ncbi:MAG: heavy-metal-associated domain-containing protein [Candidatus Margulisbacteria bacterium]|nr:heavy-metal-associated domain-containing protein [Candidatus Margulisiibacteriota bacterium]
MKRKLLILFVGTVLAVAGYGYYSSQPSHIDPQQQSPSQTDTTQHTQTTFTVDGMTCSSCESKLSKSLTSIKGIYSCEADAASGRVDIVYDKEAVSFNKIQEAVESVGYTAKMPKQEGTLQVLDYSIQVK